MSEDEPPDLALGGLAVGLATRDDEPALLRIINTIQPHLPWSAEHLRWQFFDGPAGPARLHVIRDATQIVALYAAVPHRFAAAGEPARAFMVQDLMTLPEYRGRGFIHHLGRLCRDAIEKDRDVGYAFPNERSEGSLRRNGWIELCRIPLRTAAVDAAPVAGRDAAALEPLSSPFDERADAICDDAGLAVGVRREASHLNWRYSKPGAVYQRFSIGGDRGLLVLKQYEEGAHRVLHICELLVRTGARSQLPAVLESVRRHAVDGGAAEVTAWLPVGHPYAVAFDAAGLHPDPVLKRFAFVLAPVPLRARVADAGTWHLTQGDSDVY